MIAVLNGLAHGAGALIAAVSDFRVTAINYGSANAAWSLPRLVGPSRAKDIIMTGRRVGAVEGQQIGLFDRLCDANTLIDDALELASEIASKDSGAIAVAKRLVDQADRSTLAEAWQAEHQHVLSSLDQGEHSDSEVFAKFLDPKQSA